MTEARVILTDVFQTLLNLYQLIVKVLFLEIRLYISSIYLKIIYFTVICAINFSEINELLMLNMTMAQNLIKIIKKSTLRIMKKCF